MKNKHLFDINAPDKKIFVIDNFYKNPDKVRKFALEQEYVEDLRYYKGLRSLKNFDIPDGKRFFESIIGEEITDYHGGQFQITSADNPQVYHNDTQRWAAIVYLTPYAPTQAGTRTHISLRNGLRDGFNTTEEQRDEIFSTGFYDSTQFDIVDVIGNVYNRLVIFDGHLIHSAGPYFGDSMWNGRLIHLFFFN